MLGRFPSDNASHFLATPNDVGIVTSTPLVHDSRQVDSSDESGDDSERVYR
jgi:hypothetical protein